MEAYRTAGVAAREIAARRAAVRHEDRVADEHGVADEVAQAVAGVPRRRDHARGERADRELARRPRAGGRTAGRPPGRPARGSGSSRKAFCTSRIPCPIAIFPPTAACSHGAALRWSAWAWVSRIHSQVSSGFAHEVAIASALAALACPDFGSKSSTGSTIGALARRGVRDHVAPGPRGLVAERLHFGRHGVRESTTDCRCV